MRPALLDDLLPARPGQRHGTVPDSVVVLTGDPLGGFPRTRELLPAAIRLILDVDGVATRRISEIPLDQRSPGLPQSMVLARGRSRQGSFGPDVQAFCLYKRGGRPQMLEP